MMKSTKFLAVLAGAAMFTACAEEDLFNVDNASQQMNEVVGAKLVGTDVSIVTGDISATRYAGGNSGWEAEDVIGLGWILKGIDPTVDQSVNDDPTTSRMWSNHMYNTEDGNTWTTKGNIYQGWHFAYYPWSYQSKPGFAKTYVMNPDMKGRGVPHHMSQTLYLSNRQFIDAEEDLDQETNTLRSKFEMYQAVKFIQVTATPEAESAFVKGGELAHLEITDVEINVGEGNEIFEKTVDLGAARLPKKVEYPENATAEEKDSIDNVNLANFRAALPTVWSNPTVDSVLSRNITKAELLVSTNPLENAKNVNVYFNVLAKTADLNKEDITVTFKTNDGANFVIKYNTTSDANKVAIDSLVSAYKTGGVLSTFNDLNEEGKPAKTLKNLKLSFELCANDFVTDFSAISNITEWTKAVNLVNILGRESETFGIDSTIVFTDSIYMPTKCALTVIRKNGNDKQDVEALKLAGSFKNFTWPAKLNSNDVRVYVAEGAEVDNAHTIVTRQIWNYGTLNVPAGGTAAARYTVGGSNPIINYSTINLNGMYAEAKNVNNSKGTINLVYGAFVSLAPSTEAGKIAYIVTNEDVKNPTRIQNVIKEDNTAGQALVNTLKFLGDSIQAFNFTQSIGGTEGSDDPYNPSDPTPSTPETLKNLEKVNLEIYGVRVVSDEAVTVKSVYMENNDSLRNISITNGLTVKGHGAVVCATIAGGVTTDGNVTAESITGNVIANGSTIAVVGTITGDINVENSTITAASITGKVVAKNSTITLTGNIGDTVNCEGTAIKAASIAGDINAKGGSIETTGDITNVIGEGTTFKADVIDGTVNLNGGSVTANKITDEVTLNGTTAINVPSVESNITVAGGNVTATGVTATGNLNVNAGKYTINAEAETKYANIVVAKNAELFVNEDVETTTINVAGTATVAEGVTLYYTTPAISGGFKHTGTTTGNFEYRSLGGI